MSTGLDVKWINNWRMKLKDLEGFTLGEAWTVFGPSCVLYPFKFNKPRGEAWYEDFRGSVCTPPRFIPIEFGSFRLYTVTVSKWVSDPLPWWLEERRGSVPPVTLGLSLKYGRAGKALLKGNRLINQFGCCNFFRRVQFLLLLQLYLLSMFRKFQKIYSKF